MTIHIGRKALTFLGLGALAAALLGFIAGVPLFTIFWFSLVLACPLMMLFMHGGPRRRGRAGQISETGIAAYPWGVV